MLTGSTKYACSIIFYSLIIFKKYSVDILQDFANVDMGRYLHGGVNITGFQLLDPKSKQLKEFMDSFSRLDRHTYPGAQTQKLTVHSKILLYLKTYIFSLKVVLFADFFMALNYLFIWQMKGQS